MENPENDKIVDPVDKEDFSSKLQFSATRCSLILGSVVCDATEPTMEAIRQELKKRFDAVLPAFLTDTPNDNLVNTIWECLCHETSKQTMNRMFGRMAKTTAMAVIKKLNRVTRGKEDKFILDLFLNNRDKREIEMLKKEHEERA